MNRFAWAACAASLLVAGCSSSSSNRSSTAAPVSSQSTGTPASQTSNPAPPAIPHDPGGQVAAVGSADPVQATLSTNAFAAFRELASTSGMELPADPALRGLAFVVEDSGFVRVLQLDPNPSALREVRLPGAPFPPGIAAGALRVQDANTAYVTASGMGGEAVYRFDPQTASQVSDVSSYTLTGLTVTWPAGIQNQAGLDVGGQALPLSFTSDALGIGDRLFVTSSNFDPQFTLNPGTVWSFQQDPVAQTLSAAQVIQTRGFNPTGIRLLETSAGPLLLVTDSGPFAGGEGAIDVIDPASFSTVGWIDLPGENPTGRVELSPDGRWGYLGSQTKAEVYVLDLDGFAALVGATAPVDLSNRFRGGYALPPAPGGSDFISDLAVSHSGRYLYAANFNGSQLHAIDLVRPGLAATVTGFARSGNPQNFEGLLNGIAVRPGQPGVDFNGPSLFGLTINLAVADQRVTNVNVALDAVSFDRH